MGSNIIYKLYVKSNNKTFIFLRYPDFRNEIKRHSKKYIYDYLNFLKNSYLKNNNNYILDFTGFHGYIDNKVNLWINIKNKYNRKTANYVMYNSYLIPNDYNLFLNNYNPNKNTY